MGVELLSLMCVAFVLSRRSPTVDVRHFDPDSVKIRCPRCRWQPQKQDRWFCEPGCRHHWNTFETSGICPACAKHWHETACLRCRAWSLHADWYETDQGN